MSVCFLCERKASWQCKGCRRPYCGAACQRDDWKTFGHGAQCGKPHRPTALNSLEDSVRQLETAMGASPLDARATNSAADAVMEQSKALVRDLERDLRHALEQLDNGNSARPARALAIFEEMTTALHILDEEVSHNMASSGQLDTLESYVEFVQVTQTHIMERATVQLDECFDTEDFRTYCPPNAVRHDPRFARDPEAWIYLLIRSRRALRQTAALLSAHAVYPSTDDGGVAAAASTSGPTVEEVSARLGMKAKKQVRSSTGKPYTINVDDSSSDDSDSSSDEDFGIPGFSQNETPRPVYAETPSPRRRRGADGGDDGDDPFNPANILNIGDFRELFGDSSMTFGITLIQILTDTALGVGELLRDIDATVIWMVTYYAIKRAVYNNPGGNLTMRYMAIINEWHGKRRKLVIERDTQGLPATDPIYRQKFAVLADAYITTIMLIDPTIRESPLVVAAGYATMGLEMAHGLALNGVFGEYTQGLAAMGPADISRLLEAAAQEHDNPQWFTLPKYLIRLAGSFKKESVSDYFKELARLEALKKLSWAPNTGMPSEITGKTILGSDTLKPVTVPADVTAMQSDPEFRGMVEAYNEGLAPKPTPLQVYTAIRAIEKKSTVRFFYTEAYTVKEGSSRVWEMFSHITGRITMNWHRNLAYSMMAIGVLYQGNVLAGLSTELGWNVESLAKVAFSLVAAEQVKGMTEIVVRMFAASLPDALYRKQPELADVPEKFITHLTPDKLLLRRAMVASEDWRGVVVYVRSFFAAAFNRIEPDIPTRFLRGISAFLRAALVDPTFLTRSKAGRKLFTALGLGGAVGSINDKFRYLGLMNIAFGTLYGALKLVNLVQGTLDTLAGNMTIGGVLLLVGPALLSRDPLFSIMQMMGFYVYKTQHPLLLMPLVGGAAMYFSPAAWTLVKPWLPDQKKADDIKDTLVQYFEAHWTIRGTSIVTLILTAILLFQNMGPNILELFLEAVVPMVMFSATPQQQQQQLLAVKQRVMAQGRFVNM